MLRGLVAEVYPAAALKHWRLPSRGYKGTKPAHQDVRGQIVSGIERQANGRLHLEPHRREELVSDDDRLDAFLSAIITYASLRGQALPVPDEHALEAKTEGWIHLPSVSLSELFSAPG